MLGMTHRLFKLFALLCSCCQAQLRNQRQTAEFLPNDIVSVYYGEYLLASWVLSHSPWNAYHSGVGFLNNMTGEQVLVDYSPTNTSSVTNMIFPAISLKSEKFWTWLTGDVDVKWNNGARVNYQDHWPEQYTSFTYLGAINGSIFNRYMDWFKYEFEPTHVTFEPVEVVIPTKGAGHGVPSRMCHDFVSDSLWVLYNMGAVFSPTEPIFRDHVIFYGDKWEVVDYGKAEAKRDVLRYFRTFGLHLSKIKQQFTYVREMLIVAWKMDILPFVYTENKYIRVHIAPPFLNYCYLPLAIPPKQMDLLQDQKLCALPMEANTKNQTLNVGSLDGTALAHLMAAEARLDKSHVHVCILLTCALVFLGSFRKAKGV